MESTSTSPSAATSIEPVEDAESRAASAADEVVQDESEDRTKLYAILGGLALLLLFTLITVGLYMLGGDDESALERLRDIAVIYIVLMSMIIVVLMAACTAAFVYLALQIRNQLVPLLQETNQTVNRVRGTTEFISEEAVKPIISAAGRVAQLKAMMRVISGR